MITCGFVIEPSELGMIQAEAQQQARTLKDIVEEIWAAGDSAPLQEPWTSDFDAQLSRAQKELKRLDDAAFYDRLAPQQVPKWRDLRAKVADLRKLRDTKAQVDRENYQAKLKARANYALENYPDLFNRTEDGGFVGNEAYSARLEAERKQVTK